jgi:hypothetical protein
MNDDWLLEPPDGWYTANEIERAALLRDPDYIARIAETERLRAQPAPAVDQFAALKKEIESVTWKIEHLRDCQTTQAADRAEREFAACVYLMWCPAYSAYKIGETKNLAKRFRQHKRELDHRIERRIRYNTPVRRRLERALHHHFGDVQVFPENTQSVELFRLTEEEAVGFGTIAKTIESHLLALEILHLETRLGRLKNANVEFYNALDLLFQDPGMQPIQQTAAQQTPPLA